MSIQTVNFGNSYYNNPNYNYGRAGKYQVVSQYPVKIYNIAPPPPKKKERSFLADFFLATAIGDVVTLGLAVAQKRFKLAPNQGLIDIIAKGIVGDHLYIAEKCKNKLFEKYPTSSSNNGKIVEWSKKALNGIVNFFKKEKVC